MSSTIDALLTLLDYVDDVGQLEILIEEKNLQRVMHAAGHDDAAMRRMISAGETPWDDALGCIQERANGGGTHRAHPSGGPQSGAGGQPGHSQSES